MGDVADEVIDLYRRHGVAWAKARSQQLFERTWLDRFVSHLGSSRSVLDIGCGTGQPIAHYLSQRGCTVTGIDSSPELLQLAEASMPQGRWLLRDMRELNLDEQFGGILAWHSFFHLAPDDQRKMIPIFATHTEDDAALMFTSGSHHGPKIGCLEGEPLYHASLDPTEYQDLLSENGFAVVHFVENDPDCGGATVWLATKSENLPKGPLR